MVTHILPILSTQVCLEGLLLVPLSFSYSSMIFLIVFSELAVYPDDTTLYSSLDKTKDLVDKVEMTADIEDDLPTIVEWGQKWLVIFNASKT